MLSHRLCYDFESSPKSSWRLATLHADLKIARLRSRGYFHYKLTPYELGSIRHELWAIRIANGDTGSFDASLQGAMQGHPGTSQGLIIQAHRTGRLGAHITNRVAEHIAPCEFALTHRIGGQRRVRIMPVGLKCTAQESPAA